MPKKQHRQEASAGTPPHFLAPASTSRKKRLCGSEMAAVSVSADGHFNIPEGTTTIVSRLPGSMKENVRGKHGEWTSKQ